MNILFVNLPFSGHTNPTLPLAAGLVRRGHDVTYVNSVEFRDKIEKTGARFVPYADFLEKPGENYKKKRSFRAAFDTAMSLGGDFDLLIYEMFFYPGIEIAKNMGIPCVRQFSQPAWTEETWKTAPPVFRLSAGLIDVQVMSRRNKKHMGVGRKSMTEAIIGDRPGLNIVYVPEIFQKCRESFDDTYIFSVPESGSLRNGMKTGAVIPYESMKPPIVYISLGSIISNKGFCKECIRAFGGKDMSVILNTGRVDPGTLGNIPDNIYAYSFVPQTEVLSRADVFLTHCGMNSVNEALSAGVPMVAMPFLNDQLENAAQLVRMGLARRVRSFPSRGKELYAAVLEVYNDEGYKRRAEEIMWKLEEENNFEEVLDRVEGLR